MATSTMSNRSRLTLLDALRGFSLLGVILMHMLQQYSVFSFNPEMQKSLFPTIDPIVQWIGANVIMGRFINIFAFLFGLSFFIQMDRSAQKGVDFRLRFIWRMVVMFIIGLVGAMFYSGEIITLYAFFGCILVLFYKTKSWILVALASLLLLGAPRAIQLTYRAMETKNEMVSKPSKPRIAPDKSTFLKSAELNLTSGFEGKINYQFGLFGRGYITLALFIIGFLVGRNRFFERSHSNQKIAMYFAAFVVATIVFIYAKDLFPGVSYRSLPRGEDVSALAGFAVMMFQDLSVVFFSASLLMGFMLLYQQAYGKFLDVFSPYGRMGLTNYEAQSVIGCLIFSMWAFGCYFESWGTTELFLLGIGIYIFQLVTSRIWMKYFLYGPLEWLLRSATYFKVQPFRKLK